MTGTTMAAMLVGLVGAGGCVVDTAGGREQGEDKERAAIFTVSQCKLTIAVWITEVEGNAVTDYITLAVLPYLEARLFKPEVARQHTDGLFVK